MTCLARMVEKHDLDRIIEDIELAGVKLQYIAANVDCEEANASSGRRARLKCMLLRAGASALEVAVEILGNVGECESDEKKGLAAASSPSRDLGCI